MKTLPFISDDDVQRSIPQIISHLQRGGIIAYPTETVYGFGSLIRDDALSALAALKSRDASKPFLLLIREADDIPQLKWTDSARKLAAAFWPGPLTLALTVREDFPAPILSSDGTMAVRATPHPGLRALLQQLRAPITSTSANTPGQPPATDAGAVAAVVNELGATEVLIVDGGRLPPSPPSTVVDCSGERVRVIREGAITSEALAQIVDVL